MKTLLVTLVLALLLMSGSALKCNRCIPAGSSGRCSVSVETCGYGKDACISATFTRPPFNHFRRCSSMAECLTLQASTFISARCCQRDRCN